MRYYIGEMKKRDITPKAPLVQGLEALAQALAALENSSEIKIFLQDLCTPAEMEALADRWRVVPFLIQETSYREIHEQTGVSVTTIGRVARTLNIGSGGYQAAIKRLGLTKISQ
jgi:TrpR-related protein YerC/YecD